MLAELHNLKIKLAMAERYARETQYKMIGGKYVGFKPTYWYIVADELRDKIRSIEGKLLTEIKREL